MTSSKNTFHNSGLCGAPCRLRLYIGTSSLESPSSADTGECPVISFIIASAGACPIFFDRACHLSTIQKPHLFDPFGSLIGDQLRRQDTGVCSPSTH